MAFRGSTRSMFWKRGPISIICMLLIRLYTLEPVVFPLPLPFGSMKEPYVYMLLWGSYSSGSIV